MWRTEGRWRDLFLHGAHIQNISVHCAFRCILQPQAIASTTGPSTDHASVAGLGACGPFGPRGGISSGMRPGNSSGRAGSPGSRIGGVISGLGLPGGMPGGGSVGVPGVAGGISGGSIGVTSTPCGSRRCRGAIPSPPRSPSSHKRSPFPANPRIRHRRASP